MRANFSFYDWSLHYQLFILSIHPVIPQNLKCGYLKTDACRPENCNFNLMWHNTYKVMLYHLALGSLHFINYEAVYYKKNVNYSNPNITLKPSESVGF